MEHLRKENERLRKENERLKEALRFMPPESFLTAYSLLVEARLEKGAQKYGEDAYWYKDILDELQEELLDVMAYAYFQWLKVQALREGVEEVEDWFKVGGTDCGED